MSTEFYCEEFPTEQNGKQVQTLKDLLEACPEDRFHFMTPFGYVDLTAQDAGQLRQGAVADVLRAEGVGKAAAAQPLLFQHAQDLFRRDGLGSSESPHRIRIERHPDRAEKIPARSGRKIGIVPKERPLRKRQLSEQARHFGGMGRAYSALRL